LTDFWAAVRYFLLNTLEMTTTKAKFFLSMAAAIILKRMVYRHEGLAFAWVLLSCIKMHACFITGQRPAELQNFLTGRLHSCGNFFPVFPVYFTNIKSQTFQELTGGPAMQCFESTIFGRLKKGLRNCFRNYIFFIVSGLQSKLYVSGLQSKL
jgi:hypothetical protein